MKFLASFFSDLPSSTISSLDESMYDSKRATAGCIVGVVRRLLCSASLPTYPSDHIIEDISKGEMIDREFPALGSINPGIVARLMGLDSMPKTDSSVCPHPTKGSMLRSRSLNSLNDLTEFDHTQGKHQRTKTSLSFREMPVFLEPENEEFLILSFANGSRTRELKPKGRKSNMGKAIGREEDEGRSQKTTASLRKQRVRRKVTDRPFEMDEQTRRDTYSNNSQANSHSDSEMVNQSKHVELCKQKRTHSLNRKEMSESSSEESSPVSILDFNQKFAHLDAFAPEGNSRRKLSPEQENCKQPSLCTTTVITQNNRKSDAIKSKLHKKKKQNYDTWCEIEALTNLEMKGSQNWGYMDTKDFEDMGAELGSHMLDLLLNELVDQLVLTYKIL